MAHYIHQIITQHRHRPELPTNSTTPIERTPTPLTLRVQLRIPGIPRQIVCVGLPFACPADSNDKIAAGEAAIAFTAYVPAAGAVGCFEDLSEAPSVVEGRRGGWEGETGDGAAVVAGGSVDWLWEGDAVRW